MSALLCLASVGRSGSTFLQRLLNTHPEIILFGEHEGFLRGIRSAYQQLAAPRTVALLETGRRRLGAILGAEPVTDTPGGWSIEWTNALRPADVAPSFARFVRDLVYPPAIRSPSHRYWGFKEIRYGIDDLRFLETVFPESRFLMLARDPVAVYRSQCRLGWAREVGAAKAAADFHHDFSALANAWEACRETNGIGGRTQLVCYERLVADPLAHLDLIASWLGIAPFDKEKTLAVAAAQMTPQRERWTEETEAFLNAYLSTNAEEDRQRYRAMRAAAIGVGTAETEAASTIRRPASAPAMVKHASSRRPIRTRPGVTSTKLVFLHIPMTGGSTLHEQISKSFEPAEIYPHRFLRLKGGAAEEMDRYRFFSGYFSPNDIRRIPGAKYVFTVLRDPVERLRSLCNAGVVSLATGHPELAASASGSADLSAIIPYQWGWGGDLRGAFDNAMARQLAGWITVASEGGYLKEEGGVRTPIPACEVVRLATANLRLLDFVGFTSELDTAYARVADEFGLSQASGTLPRRGRSSTPRPTAWPAGPDTTAGLEAELSCLTDLDRQVFALALAAQAPHAFADAAASPTHNRTDCGAAGGAEISIHRSGVAVAAVARRG
jgi:hypothetical protein